MVEAAEISHRDPTSTQQPQEPSYTQASTPTSSQPDLNNDPDRLSKSEIFDMLRNSRRRSVLTNLFANGGAISVEEVTSRVAADEYDTTPDEITPKQYKRVYTGLYQCHLPRMDEIGVIEFDANENMVHQTDHARQLTPFIDEGRDIPTAKIELVTAFVVGTVVILGVIGVTPFALIPTIGLAAVTIGALLGLGMLEFVA